jgi:DNA polymerase-3 subunit epsilon
MGGWGTGRVLAIDTETSGVSVDDDRIVTACAAIVDADTVHYQRSWLLAVEVDIPEAATEIHGVTTEYARANGVPVVQGIKEIAGAVQFAIRAHLPIVAYNAPFDLSILDRECRRIGLGGLADYCGADIAPVIDPLCADKAVDRYRPGKRQLTVTAELYGVPLGDDAHDATADALAAARVAFAMWRRSQASAADLLRVYADRRYPRNLVRDWQALGRMSLSELHAAQVGWYAEQAESLGMFWAREVEAKRAVVGSDEADDEAREIARQEIAELEARIASLSGEWPMRQYAAADRAVAA